MLSVTVFALSRLFKVDCEISEIARYTKPRQLLEFGFLSTLNLFGGVRVTLIQL